MKRNKVAQLISITIILATILTPFSKLPATNAQNASLSYKLFNPADETFSYTLNVDVPQTLYEYYQGQPHRSALDSDFQKFVTPYAVKPIADLLRQIYPADEDFANGVLMLIHQIPYNATVPEYYPTETLVRNNGDCDMFSLLAASIMKAGGLDVVLLHYSSQEHMNVGVRLNDPPKDARLPVYSIQSENFTFYVAESTSSTWEDGWRVGECPDDLKSATASIITLDNIELISPGQVTASFTKLSSTTLGMSMSPSIVVEGSPIKISGQIIPPVSNQNVTLYSSVNGASWIIVTNVTTQLDGRFYYQFNSKDIGNLRIRASWPGNGDFIGDTSENTSVFILPWYIIELTVAAIAAIALCVTIYFATRKKAREKQPFENERIRESTPE